MFLEYFPTSIIDHPKPLVVTIERIGDTKDNIQLFGDYGEWCKDDSRNEELTEEQNVIPRKYRKALAFTITRGMMLLPVKKIGVGLKPNRGPSVIADPKEKHLRKLDENIRSLDDERIGAWEKPVSFRRMFVECLLRASSFDTAMRLNAPRDINIRWPFNKINGTKDNINAPMRKVGGGVLEEGHVLKDGKWYRFSNTQLRDIDTLDVISDDYKFGDAVIHLPLTPYHNHRQFSNDKGFDFTSNTESLRPNLTICPPTLCTDPEFGKRLLESMDIDFDVYDEITYLEDGRIDPRMFLEGKHQFGIIKRKAVVIDDVLAEQLLDEAYQTSGKKKPTPANKDDKKVSAFGRVREEDIGFPNAHTNRIFSLHHGKTNALLTRMTCDYGAGKIIYAIMDAGDEDAEKGLANFARRGEEYKAPKRQMEILDKIVVERDIYIPIFTPRLSEQVNAVLFAYSSYHEMYSNTFIVRDERLLGRALGDNEFANEDEFLF